MRRLTIVWLCVASVAHAQAPSQETPADAPAEASAPETQAEEAPDPSRALLAEAVREYGNGSYAEAYALLLRAYEQNRTARVERVLGMTAFELRNYQGAITWLERSLETAERPLTDEMREDVRALLVRARSFLGSFTVRANVPGARIDVDGAPLEGDSVVLDLGEHEIVARAEGYESATRRVQVRGGEDEVVELVLVRLVAAQAEDPGALHRRLGIASLAVGGAFLVAGIVSSLIWADAVSTLNVNLEARACEADPQSEDILPGGAPECYDLENRYRLALPFVWVGYVGAAAFFAAGVGLAVAGAKQGDPNAVALQCGPFGVAGVGCRGSF